MIPGISPTSTPDIILRSRIFRLSPRSCCGYAPIEFFKSIHILQYSSDWTENWQDDTRYQSAQSPGFRSSDFHQRALLGRVSWNFQIDSQPAVFIKLSRLMILDITAPSLWARLFRCRVRGSEFRNFLQTSFVHVSLSRRRRNHHLSPRTEKWTQRPFGAAFIL